MFSMYVWSTAAYCWRRGLVACCALRKQGQIHFGVADLRAAMPVIVSVCIRVVYF